MKNLQLSKFALAPLYNITNPPRMHRLLPYCLIFTLLILFRILGSAMPGSQPNFQPLAALFFCGAWLLGGWRGLVFPATAWLVTYPLPAIFQGNMSYLSPSVITITFLAFAATYWLGQRLKNSSAAILLVGSLAAAITFHIITNGAAWIASPLYAKNGAGLWQSLWSGPNGSTIPSWIFLRNMMTANILFTGIVLLASRRLPAVKSQQVASLTTIH